MDNKWTMYAIYRSDNEFYECTRDGELDLNRPFRKSLRELVAPDAEPHLFDWVANEDIDVYKAQ